MSAIHIAEIVIWILVVLVIIACVVLSRKDNALKNKKNEQDERKNKRV